MSFWSSEKFQKSAAIAGLISPYDANRVKHCAYELSMGPEAFITDSKAHRKQNLSLNEQLVINPGQFALLLTEETIKIPNNAIGFISIKAGIKFKGLVNVSGFHVDPGFIGRLKFSVYNAGTKNIVLARGQPAFLIWLSDLEQATSDVYRGNHYNQQEITPEDVMQIQGEVVSPVVLKSDIKKLEHHLNILTMLVIGVLVAVAVFFLGQIAKMDIRRIKFGSESTHSVGVSDASLITQSNSLTSAPVEKPGARARNNH